MPRVYFLLLSYAIVLASWSRQSSTLVDDLRTSPESAIDGNGSEDAALAAEPSARDAGHEFVVYVTDHTPDRSPQRGIF